MARLLHLGEIVAVTNPGVEQEAVHRPGEWTQIADGPGRGYIRFVTEPEHTPQAGIADALGDLSEQTRLLVRQEIDAAQRELWTKVKSSAPAATLVATAGLFAVLATASSYRYSLRLLEKRLPPATAALVAAGVYSSGAVGAAAAALPRLRQLPAPFPTDTAQETAALVAESASRTRT